MSIVLDNGEVVPEEDTLWIEPIPEQEYVLNYLGHRFSKFNGDPKLEVYFRIHGTKFEGRYVARYLNIASFKVTGEGTAWKPKRSGDLRDEFAKIFGKEKLENVRPDRIPLRKWFSAQRIIGRVEMCKFNVKHEEIAEGAQQPKVEKLIRLVRQDDLDGNKDNSSPLPCLTFNSPLPTQPQPHLVENGSRQDELKVSAISDGNDKHWFYKEETERAKQMGAKTPDDVEQMTNGRVPAKKAEWFIY
jgi:hypothetical protein